MPRDPHTVQIEVAPSGVGCKVIVDGTELNNVAAAHLSMRAGMPTTLTLEIVNVRGSVLGQTHIRYENDGEMRLT